LFPPYLKKTLRLYSIKIGPELVLTTNKTTQAGIKKTTWPVTLRVKQKLTPRQILKIGLKE